MMFPKWDDNYSVHNAKIDEQHKKLFELAGKVEFMFDRPVYKDDIKALLADFFNYMKDHFNDEEKYMNQENQAHPATSPIADSDTGEYNDIRRKDVV